MIDYPLLGASLALALLIGICASIYPAFKASRLEPTVALIELTTVKKIYNNGSKYQKESSWRLWVRRDPARAHFLQISEGNIWDLYSSHFN